MKNGRPTKNSEIKIRKKLFSFYQTGLSANITAKKSGVNRKTVLKYFNRWNKELVTSEEKDFLTKVKNTIQQVTISLDNEIYDLTRQEKEIKLQKKIAIKEGNITNYEKLIKLVIKSKELKTKLLSEKLNLNITPTAKELIEQETEDGV